jgi:hypothetical protein
MVGQTGERLEGVAKPQPNRDVISLVRDVPACRSDVLEVLD